MPNPRPPYRFLHRIGLALLAIGAAILNERHMKIHLAMGVLLLLPLFIIKVPLIHGCLLIILFVILLMAELINTAIEATIDIITHEYHPKAKLAKDTASGMVLLSAGLFVSFGIFIYAHGMYNLSIGVWIGS
ncbi:MAG: diacylglycerol kinase [Candidatus Marinamargulisbacteria bacterium]